LRQLVRDNTATGRAESDARSLTSLIEKLDGLRARGEPPTMKPGAGKRRSPGL